MNHASHNLILAVSLSIGVALTGCGIAGPGSELPGHGGTFEEAWSFSEAITDKAPSDRGIGDDDELCQPVTSDNQYVDVVVNFDPAPELDSDASIRFLVFEYNPNIADVGADCVGGGMFELAATPARWSARIPADRADLRYYVSTATDIDGNGLSRDECVDYAVTDFDRLDPSVGPTEVLLIPLNCE